MLDRDRAEWGTLINVRNILMESSNTHAMLIYTTLDIFNANKNTDETLFT